MTFSTEKLTPTPLQHRVSDLVQRVGEASEFDDAIGAQLAALRLRMFEPLVVAVAGRIKSGKSTLVNALLGERVAPTASGECTKVVTVYRYGSSNSIRVVPLDGESYSLSFDVNGRVPEDLGLDHGSISRVEVELSNARLASMVIVDTPGLDSVDEDSSESSRAFLGLDSASLTAVSTADALIYVVSHESEMDVDQLRAFRALFTGAGMSVCTAICVLSRVDQAHVDAVDPLAASASLISEYVDELKSLVTDVIPLVGLLAETSMADGFTEADARALRVLAGSDDIDLALMSADLFLELPLPVPAGERVRLLEQLDLFGLRCSLEAIADGVGETRGLLKRLLDKSGFDRLQQAVDLAFGQRTDALKAHSVLSELDRISYRLGDGAATIRDEIDSLRTDPQFHLLEEVRAFGAWSRGQVELDAVLEADLQRMIRSADSRARLPIAADASSEEAVSAAVAAADRWRRLANDSRAGTDTVRLAQIVQTSFLNCWEELRTEVARPDD